jgi:hypothetical protein
MALAYLRHTGLPVVIAAELKIAKMWKQAK